jgi:hypothetical protein
MPEEDELKTKILAEMTVDHSDALEKNYALAKQFMRITKEGKVDVIVKDRVGGTDKIALYLIGKRYAKRADLATTEYVKNIELCNELGIIQNSLLPWLKTLRDSNIVVPGERDGNESQHTIALNAVERTLKDISKKLKGAKSEEKPEAVDTNNDTTGV